MGASPLSIISTAFSRVSWFFFPVALGEGGRDTGSQRAGRMIEERARERLNGAFVGNVSAPGSCPISSRYVTDRTSFQKATGALGNNFAHATAWPDWEQQTKTDAGNSAISSSASTLTSRNEEYQSWREPPETVKNRPPWNSMAFPDLSQRSLQTLHTCRHLKKRRSRGWRYSQGPERGLRGTRRTLHCWSGTSTAT